MRTPFLVGALPEMGRDFLAFVRRAHDEGGPFVRFHALGRRIYLLSRPEHVDHVFVRAVAKYDKGTPGFRAMRTVLGEGLITSDGARWKADRKRVLPMFRREALGDVEGLTRSYAQPAARAWARKESGRLDSGLAALVLRVVSRVVLGVDIGGDIGEGTGPIGAAIRVLVEQSSDRFLHASLLPSWAPTQRNLAYAAAKRTLAELAGELANAVERDQGGQGSLLAAMVATGALDAAALRDHLLTFLLAGHETTALALLVTLLALDAHPRALTWLREPELEPGERRARLLATLREAMRLMPPVWMLGRRVVEADEIEGERIARGSIVLVSPYLVHRRPEVFADPERFDPSRFHHRSPPAGSYLPFGYGPRSCIGAQLAERIAVAALEVLVHDYDVPIVSGPGGWRPLVTLRPAQPVIARLVPRRPVSIDACSIEHAPTVSPGCPFLARAAAG